jgi:hypothetical protein
MRVVILILSTAINADLSSSTSLAFIVLAPFVIIGWLATATLWVTMWYFWL